MNIPILFSIHVTLPGLMAALAITAGFLFLGWKVFPLLVRYWFQEEVHRAFREGVEATRKQFLDSRFGK